MQSKSGYTFETHTLHNLFIDDIGYKTYHILTLNNYEIAGIRNNFAYLFDVQESNLD